MVSIDENSVAIPGERLGSLEQFTPGNGTYIRHGYLYASLAGYKQLQEQQNGEVSLSSRWCAKKSLFKHTGFQIGGHVNTWGMVFS